METQYIQIEVQRPAPKTVTEIDESQHNGLKVVGNSVSADGTASHIEFAVKYDGKDYPVKGSQTIDANTFDVAVKKGGR
jgi:hypothetical protein